MTRAGGRPTSAGILLFRRSRDGIEVLLGHPGGPFFTGREAGHWTIPKGQAEAGEDLLAVARREFAEETGHELGEGRFLALGEIRQKSGKLVVAWAVEGDLDPAAAHSNVFAMEWPRGSGREQEFPEIDRVGWFGGMDARRLLKAAQVPFLDRLDVALEAEGRAIASRTGRAPTADEDREPGPDLADLRLDGSLALPGDVPAHA